MKQGRFREDLFYRLNVISLRVPVAARATRRRPAPGAALRRAHAGERRVRLSRARSDALAAYSWPGNVRQLENEVRRALVLADDLIQVGPPHPRGPEPEEQRSRACRRLEPAPPRRRPRGRSREGGPPPHRGQPDARGRAPRRLALRPAKDDEAPFDPHRNRRRCPRLTHEPAKAAGVVRDTWRRGLTRVLRGGNTQAWRRF